MRYYGFQPGDIVGGVAAEGACYYPFQRTCPSLDTYVESELFLR